MLTVENNLTMPLGFITRNDSSNRKRYRVRSSGGDCISYGLSLSPLLDRADELFAAAQEIENDRRDRIFIRKQILTKLAHLEDHDPTNSFIVRARKVLRRKLNLAQYRTLLSEVDRACQSVSTEVDTPEAIQLPANDGQTVRHQSTSKKEKKDLVDVRDCERLEAELLILACNEAIAFSTEKLRNWFDIENHARKLAPMIGIHPHTFEAAKRAIGARKAACAIFIILQLGNRVRDFGAYFHSVTLGKRQRQFNPAALVKRLLVTRECNALMSTAVDL